MKRGGARVKEAERWLSQAERDLAMARISAREAFHEWACFDSQQAGEKALKAILLVQGKTGVTSHSLLELLREIEKDMPDLAMLEEAAKELDRHYIATRYPDGLPGSQTPGVFYDSKDSDRCIALCASILAASVNIVRGSRPT